MAQTTTTNLNLTVTDGTTPFGSANVKENFEKIDTAVGELQTKTTQLTEKRTITPTPIKELALANFKCSVKTGNVNINGQIMCSGSSAVQMKNGKDLLVGLPKPADGMIVFHAIPWNNNQAASNNLNIPLRLCISADGKMCSYFPSALEQISVGMPISINVSYFTND